MTPFRIALATPPFPGGLDDAIRLASEYIAQASAEGAGLVCFPECFVPGYRSPAKAIRSIGEKDLQSAWSAIGEAAAAAAIHVILGTERLVGDFPVATAIVFDAQGRRAGFQDKVQIDPSEEGVYAPGRDRRIFRAGPLTFGIVICHEGWRYPETVRWAVRRGAQVVFHPHFHEAEADSFRPSTFCDPRNTFHEKAALCRAAENTCYFATVNYASAGSPTTSAVIAPDGTVVQYQPYGLEGVLIADLDLDLATGLFARRCRTESYRDFAASTGPPL